MASAAASLQHRCVFVGNIPYDATEQQLIQICEEVGPVVSFRLVVDRETQKPKGYGFCEYKDEETALSARRNLQGYEINGRQLRVDFAENDKGADRNREQGRGGPGLTSTTDGHKVLAGDSTFHQPVGLPLASTAASAMSRTLCGSQSSSLPLNQNGLQNLSALGNDPLTQYLANMSRQQLNEIMSEMKALVVQNKALAQQLLHGCPQLPKALFQVQIMLGMVTPQMMQLVNTRKTTTVPQPALQERIPSQNSLPPSHLGQATSQKEALLGPLIRPPEPQVSNAVQNPVIVRQSALPLQHAPVQPLFQQSLPPQPQVLLQGTIAGKFGVPIRPQSLGSIANQPQIPPLPTSKGLILQGQPPLLQNSRPIVATNVGHHPQPAVQDGRQQSYLPNPLTSQTDSSHHPVFLNGLDTLSKEAGSSNSVSNDLTWASRVSTVSSSGVGLAMQTGTAVEVSEATNHQPKRFRLEDGGGAHLITSNSFTTICSVPAQSIAISGNQMTNDGVQHSEKQMPQLPPEVESALLQQVMNLTPEQLTSLPPEQQQQVLQLQHMLVKQTM